MLSGVCGVTQERIGQMVNKNSIACYFTPETPKLEKKLFWLKKKGEKNRGRL